MPRKTNKNYTIGLDIGGTTIRGILYDGERVIADDQLATPKDNLDHFLVMVKAVVDPLLDKAKELKVKVGGVGLGVAGVQSSDKTTVLNSPNIPIINNVNLVEKVGAMLELPVVMDNDASCFILAEITAGAAQNKDNVYGLIVGTGIGGGWFLNGQLYDGAHGGANEPGEMVDFTGEKTLEASYHALTQNNPAQLAEEAYRGDVLAEKLYDEFGTMLGYAMANIVNLINPEIFVIGGGAVASGDLFISKAKKAMKAHIESSEAKKKTKVVKSKLGKHAGAIGAALIVGRGS